MAKIIGTILTMVMFLLSFSFRSTVEAVTQIVRSNTKVIALSNSSPESKAQADFVCDGISDEVEFNAAIASLPASGGSIKVLEGQAYFAGSVGINRGSFTIEGQGISGATQIIMSNYANSPAFKWTGSYPHIIIRNFNIFGNKNNQTAESAGIDINGVGDYTADYSIFENLQIMFWKGHGFLGGGNYICLNNIYSELCSRDNFRFDNWNKGVGSNLTSYASGENTFTALDVAGSSFTNIVAYGSSMGGWIGADMRHCYLSGIFRYNGTTDIGLGNTSTAGWNNVDVVCEGGGGNGIDTNTAAAGHNVIRAQIKGKSGGNENTGFTIVNPWNEVTGVVENCDGPGVVVGHNYNRISVTSLNNGRNAPTADYRSGILIGNTAKYNVITDCIVTDTQQIKTQLYGINRIIASAETDTDYNVFKSNQLLGNSTGSINSVGPHDEVDNVAKSEKMTLSSAAVDNEVFTASAPCKLVAYSIVYTTASSSNPGVAIRIGKYNEGMALNNSYYDSTISEISKPKGYVKWIGTSLLDNTKINVGDTVTVGTAGGKTGTGTVMVILQIMSMAD